MKELPEITVKVELVDRDTIPPAQAAAIIRARRLFDVSFRKAERKKGALRPLK